MELSEYVEQEGQWLFAKVTNLMGLRARRTTGAPACERIVERSAQRYDRVDNGDRFQQARALNTQSKHMHVS